MRGRVADKAAVVDAVILAIACLATYLLATRVLAHLYFISTDGDLLGGMWAVIATIFVIRDSYRSSVAAAASRMAATSVSFVVCLLYLLFLPFHPWALAVLIGVSVLVVSLAGRPEDAVTAAITTTVVMVVAAVTPQRAWEQPILRFVDTVIGVAVGIAAAWISRRLIHPRFVASGKAGLTQGQLESSSWSSKRHLPSSAVQHQRNAAAWASPRDAPKALPRDAPKVVSEKRGDPAHQQQISNDEL